MAWPSCTSWCVHDSVDLERRGAPVATINTSEFASLGRFRQSYHQLLWTQSLRSRHSNGRKVLPPWLLMLPIGAGLIFASAHLDSPMWSVLAAVWLLHCMRAPLRLALPVAIGIAAALTTASVYLWPLADQVLHALSALAMGGFMAAAVAWYRIRNLGIARHLRGEFTAWVVAKNGEQQSYFWLWWVLGFLILRAISAIGN